MDNRDRCELDALPLPTKVRNSLTRIGIRTIAQATELADHDPDIMPDIRGLGRTGWEQFLAVMAAQRSAGPRANWKEIDAGLHRCG